MTDRSVTKHEHSFGKPFDLRGDGLVEQCSTCDHIRPFTGRSLTSNDRSLPTLLRDAERRVNAHVFKRGGDDALASIPANPDRDVDLLLLEAAEKIERQETMLDAAQKAALHAQDHAIAMGNRAIAAIAALSGDSPAVETSGEPTEVLAQRAERILSKAGWALSLGSIAAVIEALNEIRAVEPTPAHTTEDDFQHWTSYTGGKGTLQEAFYAGANASPPGKASERPHAVNHAGDCESYCWCQMQPLNGGAEHG